MNTQQSRCVVAIVNSSTFCEAVSKLFVNRPNLLVVIRDLEGELGFRISTRTTIEAVLTGHGMTFYEKALEVAKSLDSFEKQFSQAAAGSSEFLITSQRYNFLPPLITASSQTYPGHRDFRIFESTMIQILDEIAQSDSEIRVIYLSNQSCRGLLRRIEKLDLEFVELIPFQTYICPARKHLSTRKNNLVMADSLGFLTARFTQERDGYLYYSENSVDTADSFRIFDITDCATLNSISERTDAYAVDSDFLDNHGINGIAIIPFEDDSDNKMVYIKRRDKNLSACALKFIAIMKDYFAKSSPKMTK